MINDRKKDFFYNLLGVSFNAFNSFFYLIIVSRILGMNDAGIFTTCFTLSCFFVIIGTYSGRVFQVTDIKEEINNKEYIFNRIITCSIMIFVCIIYSFIKNYDFYKFLILLILTFAKCAEAFSEVLYGIIQKNNKLYKVGFSLIVKSLISLILFYLSIKVFKNLYIACFSIFMSWIAIIFLYDFPVAKKYIIINERLNIKKSFALFKYGFYTFAFMLLSVYVISLPKYYADIFLNNELQAVFGIIFMPSSVMILISQYVISPYVNDLSVTVKNKNFYLFKEIITKIIIGFGLIGIFAILFMKLFGIQILNFIYNSSIDNYSADIIIILFGAFFSAISNVFSTALTSLRYTFIQLLIYIVCSILGTLIIIIMLQNYGIYGASVGYLFIMLIQFLMYAIVYSVTLKKVVK